MKKTTLVLLGLLFVITGCLPAPTQVPPTVTPAPSPTTPVGAKIVGQVANIDETPKTALVIPCLMGGENTCRMQQASATRVSDKGSFEIASIAPGTYTFFYGPDSATKSRSSWEDKLVRLQNAPTIAASFDPKINPDGCRDIKQEPAGGLYRIIIVMDTIWLESLSLQIDFPGGTTWGPTGATGPERSMPLQVEAKGGQTANVTLRGLGCKK